MAFPALAFGIPSTGPLFVLRLAAASIALLHLYPNTATAQETATLSGKVTVSGAPASDVTVFLKGTTRDAVSDVDRRFRIMRIPAGGYTVVAQRVGSSTVSQSVTLIDGELRTLDLALVSAPAVIAPMTVSATRELRRRDDGSVTNRRARWGRGAADTSVASIGVDEQDCRSACQRSLR